jgi:two-component system, chemotaxis family, CheB/CheR fusion protein
MTSLGLGSENVGRLGGDEFGVLVSGPDDVDLVCQRVLAAIREPLSDTDSTLFISASIGVAIGPADGDNADLLLHNADTAMYSAKQHGGDGSVYFQTSMNELAKARGVRRQKLSAAVRAESFRMHYQPVVDLVTGQAKAAEGLIRWVESDKVWTAGSFIEDAQATGLMRSIGRIGRSLVDSDLQTMEQESVDGLPISINLAVEELEDRELMQWVLRWTPPGGMSRILVEVTEQSLLAGAGMAMDTLLVFQRLGAQICIDDFGTGYSNIATLTRLRPSIIKMDMSLLLGAVEDTRGRQLLGASIQMAHALQATVVVEGIETPEPRR